MKLFFIEFVGYKQRERYLYSIYLAGCGSRGAAGVAAVRSDQLNPTGSFLVPHTGFGGI